MRKTLQLILLFGCHHAFAASWIDNSHSVLLPPVLSDRLVAVNEFPLFWWNFLILEAGAGPESLVELDHFCVEFQARNQPALRKSSCGENIEQFRSVLEDWARDQVRRNPAPSAKALRSAMDDALAKASLPLDSFLLSVLRMDPLQTYVDLQRHLQDRIHLRFPRSHGYFFDPATERVIIPVQMDFPPEQTLRTARLMESAQRLTGSSSRLHWLGMIGPHASTIENEQRIYADVKLVSTVGAGLLVLQMILMLGFRRWRLLLLIPPVLVATAISAALTVLLFGSIHGLTLSFGPGIIGLVLDHGLHSCLNLKWRGAWRANGYGLLTTLAALVAMLFSSIPFLRQLMTFSICGLLLGFGFYYLLHSRWPRLFEVHPFSYEPKPSILKFTLVLVLLLGLPAGLIFLRPSFSMQAMNYQSAENLELRDWFFEHVETKTPVIVKSEPSASPLDQAAGQAKFARDSGIDMENIASFLPPESGQIMNLVGWRSVLCDHSWRDVDHRFFEPLFASLDCSGPATIQPPATIPSYLRDFFSGGNAVSLWFPKTFLEDRLLKAREPSAISLVEIAAMFPAQIRSEVAWMAPAAILLATLFLFNYYRRVRLVFLSLIPFFSGMGLFFLVAILWRLPVSFISLIGAVMVFGLSLDYGIFATNLFTGQTGPSKTGVWSSILLAAMATICGFGPMIVAQHPVLSGLGQVLFWGTVGTVLGSIWGIPTADKFIGRRPR